MTTVRNSFNVANFWDLKFRIISLKRNRKSTRHCRQTANFHETKTFNRTHKNDIRFSTYIQGDLTFYFSVFTFWFFWFSFYSFSDSRRHIYKKKTWQKHSNFWIHDKKQKKIQIKKKMVLFVWYLAGYLKDLPKYHNVFIYNCDAIFLFCLREFRRILLVVYVHHV